MLHCIDSNYRTESIIEEDVLLLISVKIYGNLVSIRWETLVIDEIIFRIREPSSLPFIIQNAYHILTEMGRPDESQRFNCLLGLKMIDFGVPLVEFWAILLCFVFEKFKKLGYPLQHCDSKHFDRKAAIIPTEHCTPLQYIRCLHAWLFVVQFLGCGTIPKRDWYITSLPYSDWIYSRETTNPLVGTNPAEILNSLRRHVAISAHR